MGFGSWISPLKIILEILIKIFADKTAKDGFKMYFFLAETFIQYVQEALTNFV